VGQGLRGVFNVAGPQPIPLSLLVAKAGRARVTLPEPVLARLLGRFGLPGLSRGAISHIKYPVVVDPELFQKTTGFRHEIDEMATLAEFRRIAPPLTFGRRRN
jgi:UDP-glucose 4-epimerase